ncbi:hypothetical protein [Chamaesiphon sp. VAR_69_metabat_338]|uniref:hypothetical protein n=1 Tax=Chamaesiphon sp. VAR_69_metabat_338 TaxID=2964704 RepID=UPI00286E38A0|nr:hypothetical protein [Chamaesiphon sp. VAR_69_metabat_338]
MKWAVFGDRLTDRQIVSTSLTANSTRSWRQLRSPDYLWYPIETIAADLCGTGDTTKVKQALMAACLEILSNHRQIPTEAADLMRSISI